MDIQQAEEDSGGDTEEYGGGDKESMAVTRRSMAARALADMLSLLTAVVSAFT